jgi:Flp pilus assembly secretin CpaC
MAFAPVRADTVSINVDQARVMRLPDRVATIVIGNPLIADATLQSGGIVVLTGKGYGETNMLALDRAGKIIMDKTIQVVGPGSSELVVVYKGVQRESYSCAPDCERRITLGDSTDFFNATLSQTGARAGQAQGASPGAAR